MRRFCHAAISTQRTAISYFSGEPLGTTVAGSFISRTLFLSRFCVF